MDLAQELLKAWGPPGIVALLMWWMLQKVSSESEKREEKKDLRIQMLENLLTESYDERIAAAERIAEALHASAAAQNALINEIRARK